MADRYTNDPTRNAGAFTTHDPTIEQGGGGEPPPEPAPIFHVPDRSIYPGPSDA